MKLKVTVNGRELSAESGEILSDLLIGNGYSHPRPCGGRGVCGKCRVLVDGRTELACRYVLSSDVTVEAADEGEILSESLAVTDSDGGSGTDLVLDIGTTTLAMALIDSKERKIIRVITDKNPQRALGADVISRIEYSQKNGASELSRLIRDKISEMIAKIGAVGISTLHAAGNTTMLHLLAGADPTSMGAAPYTPVFLYELTENAEKFGIIGVSSVHLLPSISAFVGADLVAGISYVGMPREKFRLLVDLGTNAEVVLFSADRILSTAAAAGPCFEGAEISCGMSAASGAIYAYDGNEPRTVGDAPPCGICGTGLIDIIAFLLKAGIVDESGYMEDEVFDICEGVFLTRSDIRRFQLAKSAIISAILTLMKKADADHSDIEGLYISGGFSAKMNFDSAVSTGLIPAGLRSVCVPIGNSSLLGTVKAVLENTDFDPILEKAEYVDLSDSEFFSDLFIDNITFRSDPD